MFEKIFLVGVALSLTLFVFDVQGQNTFDGTNVILDAPSVGGSPAVRYGSDSEIFVHNLQSNEPLSACPSYMPSGSSSPTYDSNSGLWEIPRNPNNGYWCFKSTKSTEYTVSWQWSGQIKWFANSAWTGLVNVKEFGAIGDGISNDISPFRNALIYLAGKGGGTLHVPTGKYRMADSVGGITLPLTLPSGIRIQGVAGRSTSTFVNPFNPDSPTKLLNDSTCPQNGGPVTKAIFRIGENSENIRISDVEFRGTSTNCTAGLEALGKLTVNGNQVTGTTQVVSVTNTVFSNLDFGFVARSPTPSENWQFDYVKVENSLFAYNKTAGIYIDIPNTEWNIDSTTFFLPGFSENVPADAIFIRRAGSIKLNSVWAGGDNYGETQGGDFLDVRSIGSLTISASGSERANNSIVFGDDPNAGSVSTNITVVGSIFGDPIRLLKRVNYISVGNFYLGDTVQAMDPRVSIFSTGDKFCYDTVVQGVPPCGPGGTSGIGFQGVGRIVFQTGQLDDSGIVPSLPTKIGTDVEIESDKPADENKPILRVVAPNIPGQGKTLIELGQNPFLYRIGRDRNTGYLTFTGTQGSPWQGYSFDAPLKLANVNYSQLAGFSTAGQGALVYCLDCVPNSSPCQSGGAGALAVSSSSQWNCK